MSRESERLFQILSGVSDSRLDEAAEWRPRRRVRRWALLAAVLALAAGIGCWSLPRMESGAGSVSGGAAPADLSCAGPVLVLTLEGEDAAVTVRREITLDFSPWIPEGEQAGCPEGGCEAASTDIWVTDAYLLTNASQREQTVTVRYPFTAARNQRPENRPILTLDGTELETELREDRAGGPALQDAGSPDAADPVAYLEALVSLPAGGEARLTAVMRKETAPASGGGSQGVYGLCVAARPGAGLSVTAQRAVLEDRGQIEIVRQNFGFDLEAGVRTVELEPETAYYRLEVRRLTD